MSRAELLSIKEPTFAIEAVHEGDRFLVTFSGNADMGAAAKLDAYFPALHVEAERLAIARADLDLRQLEFMSSSCFKSLITWLGKVMEMPESARYRIHLISNPQLHWQRRSLKALQLFAEDLVTIEG